MKKRAFFFLPIVALLLASAFVACSSGDDDGSPQTVTVTFYGDTTSATPRTTTIESGKTLSENLAQAPEGYTFKAWISADGTDYTNRPITSDVTLFAYFEKISTETSGATTTTTIHGEALIKETVTVETVTEENGEKTTTTTTTVTTKDTDGNTVSTEKTEVAADGTTTTIVTDAAGNTTTTVTDKDGATTVTTTGSEGKYDIPVVINLPAPVGANPFVGKTFYDNYRYKYVYGDTTYEVYRPLYNGDIYSVGGTAASSIEYQLFGRFAYSYDTVQGKRYTKVIAYYDRNGTAYTTISDIADYQGYLKQRKDFLASERYNSSIYALSGGTLSSVNTFTSGDITTLGNAVYFYSGDVYITDTIQLRKEADVAYHITPTYDTTAHTLTGTLTREEKNSISVLGNCTAVYTYELSADKQTADVTLQFLTLPAGCDDLDTTTVFSAEYYYDFDVLTEAAKDSPDYTAATELTAVVPLPNSVGKNELTGLTCEGKKTSDGITYTYKYVFSDTELLEYRKKETDASYQRYRSFVYSYNSEGDESNSPYFTARLKAYYVNDVAYTTPKAVIAANNYEKSAIMVARYDAYFSKLHKYYYRTQDGKFYAQATSRYNDISQYYTTGFYTNSRQGGINRLSIYGFRAYLQLNRDDLFYYYFIPQFTENTISGTVYRLFTTDITTSEIAEKIGTMSGSWNLADTTSGSKRAYLTFTELPDELAHLKGAKYMLNASSSTLINGFTAFKDIIDSSYSIRYVGSTEYEGELRTVTIAYSDDAWVQTIRLGNSGIEFFIGKGTYKLLSGDTTNGTVELTMTHQYDQSGNTTSLVELETPVTMTETITNGTIQISMFDTNITLTKQ